ncbi:hypothetical protein P9112_012503 [Eukaryota sp. TZLM1-RC]
MFYHYKALCRLALTGVVFAIFLTFNQPNNHNQALFFLKDSPDECVPPSNPEHQCYYVTSTDACTSIPELIDYLKLYYCHLSTKPLILNIVFFSTILLLLFSLLSGTAEKYFVPVLEQLVDVFKMSSDLASVTLLAVANGGPDIASQIGSLNSNEVAMALGSVLGAGLFVILIVLGAIIIVVKPKQNDVIITRIPFCRNVGFYLLSLVFLAYLVYKQKVYLIEALFFPSLYGVYVLVVLLSNRRKKRSVLLNVQDDEDSELGSVLLEEQFSTQINHPKTPLFPSFKWEDKSFFEKIGYVLEFPLTILRNISIPIVSSENPSLFLNGIAPIGFVFLGPFVVTHSISVFQSAKFLAILVLTVGFCVWSVVDSKHRSIPRPRSLWCLLALVSSCLWLFVSADELVSLLRSLGIILHIPASVLGFTVLAFGNSAADLVANVFVSKNDINLGIGAVFSGPVLNLLLGTGVAIIPLCAKEGFVLNVDSSIVFTVVFIIVCCCFILLLFVLFKFKPPLFVGVVLLVFYAVYVSVAMFLGLDSS